MPRRSPFDIILSKAERAELLARSRRYTSRYRDVIRAKIVLLASEGMANDMIAARLDTPRQIVSKWRRRFHLNDCPGSKNSRAAGDRRAFPPSVIVDVKALACELPARRGLPLARWSFSELRREVIAKGIVAQISGTTLWRWLEPGCIAPLAASLLDIPARPGFAVKAGRILDLYHRRWQGKPLGKRDYVLCADEKTSIQARRRKHPSLPPAPGRPIYVEHEYARAGAWAYLAAWDVHRAKLFGRCEGKTGIAPFDRLVAQVMREEPYRSARRVFWITDNGSSHRGRRAADRSAGQMAKHHSRSHPGACQLAQPDRGLLLDCPAQASQPQ